MNIIDMIANDPNVSPVLAGALRKSGAADHYDCELIRHGDDPVVVESAFSRLWNRRFPGAPRFNSSLGSIHDRGSDRSHEVRAQESGPDAGWYTEEEERAAAERMGGI